MAITDTAKRGPGRPPKLALEEEKMVDEPLQDRAIKLIVRAISINNLFNPDGSQPLEAIEGYVNSYLNNGYKLMQVQFIRTHTAPDSPQPMAIELMFVLYKE